MSYAEFKASTISIHALRVEGDPVYGYIGRAEDIFLSTPSGWRATINTAFDATQSVKFLSTPSGWRATDGVYNLIASITISIHALRVEGDHALQAVADARSINFYPRPPGGGRLDAAYFLCG